MGEVLRLPNTFETLTCGDCGVVFAIEQHYVNELRRSHATWYCPNGHPRYFAEKSDIEKLKEQLAEKDKYIENGKVRFQWAEQRAEQLHVDKKRAERSAASYKGKLKHVKNRVGNGVCPCCRRSFQNLQRHMATRHPKFKGEE